MDLKAIGFNYSWIEGRSLIEKHRHENRNNKITAEREKLLPNDTKKSVENQDKGNIVDVSF
jgi:hypothetical protein